MPPRVAWKRSPTSSAATNWASIRNGAGCTLRWSQVVVQPPRASSAIATVHPLQIVADGEIEMLAHDTPLDLLADRMALAGARPGDLVAVFRSGAYGPSASPAAFLSHPPAREVLV